MKWGPVVGAKKHKYSTIPSNFDTQQTSYSAPQNYHTLAPVSSKFLRRPSPTQPVQIDHSYRVNSVNNAYSGPSSNKELSYAGYNHQQQSYSNSIPISVFDK